MEQVQDTWVRTPLRRLKSRIWAPGDSPFVDFALDQEAKRLRYSEEAMDTQAYTRAQLFPTDQDTLLYTPVELDTLDYN